MAHMPRLEEENARLRSHLALVEATAVGSLVPAFERLDRFAAFAADWDSYGALPPTPTAISMAKTLIVRVAGSEGSAVGERALPWAIALFSEGVLLEWRTGDEAVEIEISGSGDIGYLRQRSGDGNAAADKGDAISIDQAWNYVHDLFAGNKAIRMERISPEDELYRRLAPDQMLALVDLGLANAVADSESLLALDDDWDGAGSPGYVADTWRRAVTLLIAVASHLRDEFRRRLGSVEILPGSYGNIDLELHTAERMLFLSTPADQDSSIRYYGHDAPRTNTTKGTLDLRSGHRWLAGWLAGE